MKFITKLIAVCALCFTSLTAGAASNPYEVANSIAKQAFADLKANSDKLSDQKVVLDIINKDLLPYVDVKYAAYKVIGTSLDKTSKEEREEFASAFGDYMMRSMSNAIGKYTNQDLTESPVQQVAADVTIVPVKYVLTTPGKSDVNFIVKMRLNKKTGQWKAFDLIAENISILDAKSAELSPIIRDKGIKEAIRVLQTSKE